MGKSSKQKISEKMTKLNPYDKANHRFGMSVNIEKKEIDGKPVTSFSCDSYGSPECVCIDGEPKPEPLRKEFTGKESFMGYIGKVIDDIEKQI